MLRLIAWHNNSVQVQLINKINNISDNQLKSITPSGLDPEMAVGLIKYSNFDALHITIPINGVEKTVRFGLTSIG